MVITEDYTIYQLAMVQKYIQRVFSKQYMNDHC